MPSLTIFPADATRSPSGPRLSSENVHEAARALYWHCAHNHNGSGSELYRVLSLVSEVYKPGSCEAGPDVRDDSMHFYRALKAGTIGAEMFFDCIKLILDVEITE